MPPFNTSRRASEDSSQSSGSEYIVKNILLVVKTYPLPSNKYNESVCSVGITEDGEWMRIYPLEWFSLPMEQQPKKYQWMRVPVRSRAPQDRRVESYQPEGTQIQLGNVLSTDNFWQARNEVVLPMQIKSIEEMFADNRSLALIKPAGKPEFITEPDKADWGVKKEAQMKQVSLFGRQRVQLRKVPWKFSYKFKCQDKRCTGHKLSILDWEVFRLYEQMHKKLGNATDLILQAMEKTWLDTMWGPQRDSYLYIGTTLQYNSPVVLGVYYPPVHPKANQATLL